MGALKSPFGGKSDSRQHETISLCLSDRSSSTSGDSHSQVLQKKLKRYARWAMEGARQEGLWQLQPPSSQGCRNNPVPTRLPEAIDTTEGQKTPRARGLQPRCGATHADSGNKSFVHAGTCCSVTQSCPTLCNPMDCSIPGSLVLHCLPEFAQTHVLESMIPSNHLILCHPPFPPALNLSQHQGLFQFVSSSHQVAKMLELRL